MQFSYQYCYQRAESADEKLYYLHIFFCQYDSFARDIFKY